MAQPSYYGPPQPPPPQSHGCRNVAIVALVIFVAFLVLAVIFGGTLLSRLN